MSAKISKIALKISVKGIVQGVGFQPFVYNLAQKYQIVGWILISNDGASIFVEGKERLLDTFVIEISEHAPAAAKIKEISIEETKPKGFKNFEIRFSCDSDPKEITLLSPDLAVCKDCTAELSDSKNRRYRYPFISCASCGPRFSIIDKLPYDRLNTSMHKFAMCDTCRAEYDKPNDRRFRSHSNACVDCGPSMYFKSLVDDKFLVNTDEVFEASVALIKSGGILAFKGLSGFYLMCDAENEQAVTKLRSWKKTSKAFACMFANVRGIKEFCDVSSEEANLLDSCEKPIVLLKNTRKSFSKYINQGLKELGCMLPYTPAQALLLHDFTKAGGVAVAIVSGNFYNEPIIIDDTVAVNKFAGIADAIVGDNRKIVTRCVDSICRLLDLGNSQTAIQFIHRARGHVPNFFMLKSEKSIFSFGSDQNNTFSFVQDSHCFVSQHIGDIKYAKVADFFTEMRMKYAELFNFKPEFYVADLHSEYLISTEAKTAAKKDGIKFEEVQHHHAHIASVLGENSLKGPAIGFAFDWKGHGIDNCIWGGEVLLANTCDFERFANLVYFPIPGGKACIKDPLCMAYALLYSCDLHNSKIASRIFKSAKFDCHIIENMIEQSVDISYSSSIGRLFDAVSALVEIIQISNYEAEPAIMLEAVCAECEINDAYEFVLVKNTATKHSTAQDTAVILIDYKKVFEGILEDINAGVDACIIAVKFHNSVVNMMVQLALCANQIYGINLVALSGGCFMNRRLIEAAVAALSQAGFEVAINLELPPNDENISFGQAVVSANRLKVE